MGRGDKLCSMSKPRDLLHSVRTTVKYYIESENLLREETSGPLISKKKILILTVLISLTVMVISVCSYHTLKVCNF